MTFGPDVVMDKTWRMWTDAAAVQQNSDGSVVIRGGGNGYNAQIATATPNADGTYTGTAFGGGGYFEATISFVGAPVMNGGWPSFWANDIENQINERTGNGVSQWQGQPQGFVNNIEVDFLECMTGSGSYGIAMHNWYGFQSSIQSVNSGNVSGSPVSLPAGTDTSKPHKYGFLWVPASGSAKGTGQFFFDGKQVGNTISWNQYNPNTPPPPVVGDTAFSVLDSRNLYLILGTGPSNPMTVSSVTAWQKPGSGSSPLGKMTNNIPVAQAQINGATAFTKAMTQVQATQKPSAAPDVASLAAPLSSGSVADMSSPAPSMQAPLTAPVAAPTATVSKGVRQSSSLSGQMPTPIPVGTATLSPNSATLTMPLDTQARMTALENELQQVQQEMAALQQDIATQSAGGAAAAQAAATKPPQAGGKGSQRDDPDGPGDADD
jgi:hypothetical protein